LLSPVALAATEDVGRPRAFNQEPGVIDATNYPPPADPEPVSGLEFAKSESGVLAGQSGSCQQELSEPEESMTEHGLMVCTSTAPGTAAVTGVVLGPSGDPVTAAVVQLVPSIGATSCLSRLT